LPVFAAETWGNPLRHRSNLSRETGGCVSRILRLPAALSIQRRSEDTPLIPIDLYLELGEALIPFSVADAFPTDAAAATLSDSDSVPSDAGQRYGR